LLESICSLGPESLVFTSTVGVNTRERRENMRESKYERGTLTLKYERDPLTTSDPHVRVNMRESEHERECIRERVNTRERRHSQGKRVPHKYEIRERHSRCESIESRQDKTLVKTHIESAYYSINTSLVVNTRLVWTRLYWRLVLTRIPPVSAYYITRVDYETRIDVGLDESLSRQDKTLVNTSIEVLTLVNTSIEVLTLVNTSIEVLTLVNTSIEVLTLVSLPQQRY